MSLITVIREQFMTLPTIRRGPKTYRSTGYLATVRYGKHIRTIARWDKAGLLPKPISSSTAGSIGSTRRSIVTMKRAQNGPIRAQLALVG
jgi:hypothetical protein